MGTGQGPEKAMRENKCRQLLIHPQKLFLSFSLSRLTPLAVKMREVGIKDSAQ